MQSRTVTHRDAGMQSHTVTQLLHIQNVCKPPLLLLTTVRSCRLFIFFSEKGETIFDSSMSSQTSIIERQWRRAKRLNDFNAFKKKKERCFGD
jgi:hypothetical protein